MVGQFFIRSVTVRDGLLRPLRGSLLLLRNGDFLDNKYGLGLEHGEFLRRKTSVGIVPRPGMADACPPEAVFLCGNADHGVTYNHGLTRSSAVPAHSLVAPPVVREETTTLRAAPSCVGGTTSRFGTRPSGSPLSFVNAIIAARASA